MFTWPDEHTHWQGVVKAAPEQSVPFAVHVFVFHTREQLREACGDERAAAHSMTYPEPDDTGVGAVIMFSLEELHLSLVAHEVAHVTMFHAGEVEHTRVGAKKWLRDHPEWVAEMTGNLTAIIWGALINNCGEQP